MTQEQIVVAQKKIVAFTVLKLVSKVTSYVLLSIVAGNSSFALGIAVGASFFGLEVFGYFQSKVIMDMQTVQTDTLAKLIEDMEIETNRENWN